jgi:carboxyl-terminal processing protease
MSSVPQVLSKAIGAVLVAGVLAVGLWWGGHPDDLPGFLRSAFVADNQTRVVGEAIQRIAHDYYRPISPSQLSNASIAGAVASLDDRFSHYLTPSEFREFNAPPHFTGIGVAVGPSTGGLLIGHVFDNSPAARAGLRAGELIVAVNGKALRGVGAERAIAMIKGPPGTDVRIGIQEASAHPRRETLTITRATISEPVVASATRTVGGKKLGIVALAAFTPGAHGEVGEAVKKLLREGARGILLDLRGNGGGLVEEAQLIASEFIQRGTIVTTRGRTQPSQTLVALGDAIAPHQPMVVFVDSGTASSAEIVTAALQDHRRATVVGTHTFGKGVFQEEQELANGGALDITVGEYFTPSGRNLGGGGVKQGAGVTPEVTLPSSQVDTPTGLERALAVLAGKLG